MFIFVRMKQVVVILLLLLPLHAVCFDKHKPVKIPVSRWKEVKRMKPDSTLISFKDTLFVAFRPKDSFSYHIPGGFIYNGKYSVDEDSILDFGYTRYKIAVKKPLSLVLLDDIGIHQFSIDSSDTAKIVVLEKEEKILPVASIDQMIGKWTVYKRTAKEQTGTIDNATAIRSMYITGPSTDGKLGYVYGGKDLLNDPSWYIKGFSSDQTLSCDGKNPRTLKVIKCQKGELIVQEEDITYYLKQFK
jgi:hypothetical protein